MTAEYTWALDTKELAVVEELVMPDAQKYFLERPGSSESAPSKLPALAETLKAAFDEKSLFPNYILDYERNMKNYHASMLSGAQQKPKTVRTNLQGTVVGQTGQTISQQQRTSTQSPHRSIKGGSLKLKPISQARKSSVST